MRYRNAYKANPFEAARRNIQSRLVQLQEAIMSKFEQGEQRQIMRRTMRQLLDVQQTTEGKIQRLIALIDQIDLQGEKLQRDKNNTTSCQSLKRTKSRKSGQMSIQKFDKNDRYLSNKGVNRSVQYSPSSIILGKHGKSTTEERRSRQQNNQEQYSLSEEMSSYDCSQNSPFSKYSTMKIEDNISDIKHSPKQSGELRVYDSINEKDIFSFRTQKECPQIYYEQEKRKSEGQPILKKSKSKKYNDKSCDSIKQSQKKWNYDGYSQTYIPDQSKLSRIASSQISNKKILKNGPQLFKKISNRIIVSECVIDKINHSGTKQNTINVANRHLLETQVRRDLIDQFINDLNKSSVWK